MRFGMKKQQKNLGPIGPFLDVPFWQIEKTYLHYMSILKVVRF